MLFSGGLNSVAYSGKGLCFPDFLHVQLYSMHQAVYLDCLAE